MVCGQLLLNVATTAAAQGAIELDPRSDDGRGAGEPGETRTGAAGGAAARDTNRSVATDAPGDA